MIKTLQNLRPHVVRIGAITLLASLVSACATNFTADVTRLQQLPQPAGETIEVMPKNPNEAGNLSFKQYAQMIGSHLGQVGYKPPVSGTPSALIATIDYGVSSGPAPATVKRSSPVQIGIGVGTGGPSFRFRRRHPQIRAAGQQSLAQTDGQPPGGWSGSL